MCSYIIWNCYGECKDSFYYYYFKSFSLIKMQIKKHKGKCIGIVEGKVVVESKSIDKVIKTLAKDYPDKETIITTVPYLLLFF